MSLRSFPVLELGIPEMDATHAGFSEQVARVALSGDSELAGQLAELIAHTQQHFDNESRLMQECAFPARAEHESEHRRVLAELEQMRQFAAKGKARLARLYVSEGVPDWFRNHLASMDAALAARLKQTRTQKQAA